MRSLSKAAAFSAILVLGATAAMAQTGATVTTTVLTYAPAPTGKLRLIKTGHAVDFVRAPGPAFVEAIEIFASRYGSAQAPKRDYHIYVLHSSGQVLADVAFPASTIERGEPKWYRIATPPIEVTERFGVVAYFRSDENEGVFVGFSMLPNAAHSFQGLPYRKFTPVDGKYEWAIRVELTPRPSVAQGVKLLANFQPVDIERALERRMTVAYDTGRPAGFVDCGVEGPIMRFDLSDVTPDGFSDGNVYLESLDIYANRYGSMSAAANSVRFEVLIYDQGGNKLDHGSFEYRPLGLSPKWTRFNYAKPVNLRYGTGAIDVAIVPMTKPTQGIHFHYTPAGEKAHSKIGLYDRQVKDTPGREWMIRATFKFQDQ